MRAAATIVVGPKVATEGPIWAHAKAGIDRAVDGTDPAVLGVALRVAKPTARDELLPAVLKLSELEQRTEGGIPSRAGHDQVSRSPLRSRFRSLKKGSATRREFQADSRDRNPRPRVSRLSARSQQR